MSSTSGIIHKVVLLDCPLEYKKGESNMAATWPCLSAKTASLVDVSLWLRDCLSRFVLCSGLLAASASIWPKVESLVPGTRGQTNVEITKESDWEKLLQQEEVPLLVGRSDRRPFS